MRHFLENLNLHPGKKIERQILQWSYFDLAFQDGMPLVYDFVIRRCYCGHSNLIGALEALVGSGYGN